MMCLAWKIGTPCGDKHGIYKHGQCPDVNWFWWLSGLGAAVLAFKKFGKRA